KTPERYGDSLVFSAYRVPEDIEGERLKTDLDRMIAKYVALFGAAPKTRVAEKNAVTQTVPEVVAPYTVTDALHELFMEEKQLNRILDLWERKTNIILQGPPGVGKSFVCRRLAYALMKERANNRIEAVQFHQTYAYEDFVQGYRPSEVQAGFQR